MQPGYAATPLLNRPQLSAPPALAFVTPADLGAPLYGMRSRMSDGRRALVSARGPRRSASSLVAREGGAAFFSRPDWRARLTALVASAAPAPFESDGRAGTRDRRRARAEPVDPERAPQDQHRRAHLPAVGHLRRRDARHARAHRLSIRLRQPPARTARRPRRRRSLLAEAAAEPLHHAPAGARPAVLVFMTSAVSRGRRRRHRLPQQSRDTGRDASRRWTRPAARAPAARSSTPPAPTAPLDWLRDAYPDVRVRALPNNDGPNPGRNIGIRETPQPYVFLMDADVHVQPDTIQRLRAAMADRSHDRHRQSRSSSTPAIRRRFSTRAAACTSSAKRSTRG